MTVHTHRHTHVHLHTRAHTHSLGTGPYSRITQREPSLHLYLQKPAARVAFKTPSPIHRVSEGMRSVRIGAWHRLHVCSVLHTLPSPVFSTSWIGVISQQNTAPSGALSFLPQSLPTQLSAGCLEEADSHVRTQSMLPAHHGPCSKAGKTLQNPHKAPHAHLHLAGASGWVGSGRDPRLNLSCYSAYEY